MNRKRIISVIILTAFCAYPQDDELARMEKEYEAYKAHVAKLEKAAKLKRDLEEMKAHGARLEAYLNSTAPAAPSDTVSKAPTGKVINVEISWTYPQEQPSETPALAVETKSEESGGSGVRSFRPELFTGRGATAIGAEIELGHIGESGFYVSGSVNGGAAYFGGGFNFGGTLNKDGNVKSVLGVTAGFWSAPVRVIVPDIFYGGSLHRDHNYSFGGLYWKLTFGEEKHFDITNKILFGYREEYKQGSYGSWSSGWYDVRGNVTWSVGVGYTLIKKRGK